MRAAAGPPTWKWAGPRPAWCSGSQVGGAKEVNGAAGRAQTKRLDSGGERAQDLPRVFDNT